MGAPGSIRTWADIRPGEGSTFAALFLQCFCTGCATAFYFVFANANFLKHTGVTSLPLGYALSGLLGLLLVSGYKQIMVRKGIVPAYISCILAYSLLCGLLYIAIRYCQGDAQASLILAYVAFIFIMPFATMFGLSFSTLYLMVHNLAQSKRLMALVAAGDTVAAILAYLAMPLILKLAHNDTMVLLPCICLLVLVALWPVWYLDRNHRERIRTGARTGAPKRINWKRFFKDRFYLGFAAVTFFSILAVFLADYAYLVSVRFLAVDNQMPVAVIIAWVFSLIKAGELVCSFMSRSMISRWGIRFSLLLLPVLLTLCSLLGTLSALWLKGLSLFLIMFLLLSKWNERVIRKGISVPAMKVMYQVVRPEERVRLQTLIDGSLSQVYTIVAGLLLWAVSSLWYRPGQPLHLLFVIAVAGALAFSLWAWCSQGLFNAYKVRIQQFLYRGRRPEPLPGQHLTAEHSLRPAADAGSAALADWHQLVDAQRCSWQREDASYLLTLIAHYNPRINIPDAGQPEETVCRKLVGLYFDNDHLFSRLLIIWYIRYGMPGQSVAFFREVYDISDVVLSGQLLAMLNAASYKPSGEDRFYFVDACEQCVQEMIWTEAALEDLSDLDQDELKAALRNLHSDLKALMFRLLRILYDTRMIEAVQEHMEASSVSAEASMFALELLDNLLDTGLRQQVVTVLSDLPPAARKARYRELGFVYTMQPAERLKELLMKSFKLVNPYLRQLALVAYHQLTGDEQVTAAFTLSVHENLSAMAHALLKLNIADGLFYKKRVLDDISNELGNRPLLVSYFLSGVVPEARRNWLPERDPGNNLSPDGRTFFLFIDQYRLSVDVLGLTLLEHIRQPDPILKPTL